MAWNRPASADSHDGVRHGHVGATGRRAQRYALTQAIILVAVLLSSLGVYAAIPAKVTTSTDANTYESPEQLCSLVYTYWPTYRASEYCGSVEILNGCPTWQQLNTSRTIKVSLKAESAPSCPAPPTYATYPQWWYAKCPANSTYNQAGGCVCNSGYKQYLGECVPNQGYIPRKNEGAPSCDGDPCNPTTAQQFEKEELFSTVGTKLPLSVALSYNSTHNYISDPQWVGTFGYGWISNYEMRIRDYSSPTTATGAAPAVVGIVRPDGREFQFTAPASGNAYVKDADVNDRLERLVDAGGATTGWRYVVAIDDTVEIYDVAGMLTSITTRSGEAQTLTYSDASTPSTIAPRAGLLIDVRTNFGSHITFAYDALGRVVSIADPGGYPYALAYDESSSVVVGGNPLGSNLTSITYPDGKRKTFYYNEQDKVANTNKPHHLTGIGDESGSRFLTVYYTGWGGVHRSEQAGGANKITITFATNAVTITPYIADPNTPGTARTYSYSPVVGVNKVLSLSQPCSNCNTRYKTATFDANGNRATSVDYRNYTTQFSYDLARNLETSRTEAFGTPRASTITTQWHSTYRLPTQIDEPGKRTTYTHDASGNILTKTELDTTTSTSRTWTYTYNSYGQVLTANGPRTDVSDVTTYTYYNCTTGYQCGQLETITNAAGHVTTYTTYNAHGQPLTITDPNGVVTTLTYDARQRLTSRTVGSEQTTFTYWPTGLLKKATLPDGSYLEYTYDAAHRLTGINDAEGNRIAYTLDAMGNRTAEQLYDPSNALTQTRTRVFNTLNRLWKEIGAAGTTNVTTEFGYDNNGNQTAINAPLSRNSTQNYDELNRLTQVTDPLLGNTQYGYNGLDQLISVTDPRGKVTSYTYNALGDLTQQVSPDTGTTTNTYDAGGNLATSTDARSKTATYAYDAMNRVTSVTYPDQTIGYTYDSGTNQKGRLTQVTDASGSTSWGYDAKGRVLSRQQSMGVTKILGYSYDTHGRLQTLTLPSGNTVTYGYTNGKVTSLTLNGSTPILSNVLYQPFGATRGWTWGNATLAVREFDTDGKVTDIDSAGLKTYSYDDAFRITGITDAANSSLNQSYGYDLLDRLTSATGTGLNQSWTYDANGNRLTQGGSQPSTYTISTTSNRLSSITGTLTRTYSYDNAGNTTGDGAATFAYNDAGRMVSAAKAGVTTTYALNALGQRVKKTSAGSSTYFVYDEAGHLLGEYDNSGNLIQETVWFDDIPVATLRPSGGGGISHFYVHTDHLNTPRRISRPNDNVVLWRWDADPFGTAGVNQDPDGDSNLFGYNLRFPGQYFDQDTGLHYNYMRDYDPQTGRYVQSDPIGLDGGLNTYGYADQNPLTHIDPTGERWKAIWEGCKQVWKWITKSKPKPKPKPELPDPKRLEKCREAFLACLSDDRFQESLCFASYETCIATKTPMIFPGYGPVR